MVVFRTYDIYCPLFILITICTSPCFSDDACRFSGVAYSNLNKLITANNHQAVDLYRSFSAVSNENLFFSPFSISVAFGMLFYGARGQTAEELRQALGYNRNALPDEGVHASFKCLLNEISHNRDPSYVLEIPIIILFEKRVFLLPAYKVNVRHFYQSMAEVADIRGNPEGVKNVVNGWVSGQTHGKVDKLLNVLNPETAMILLNAVYFKGTWRNQFIPKNTRMSTFYNWGYEAVRVPTMRLRAILPFVETEQFRALEMPYSGTGNLSMLIILPSTPNGLPAIENSLTIQLLANIKRSLRANQRIQVHLPRFSLQDSKELAPILPGLGIRKIFSTAADLSGMSPTPNVHVSRIVHRAVVEVNEEGSVASAATGMKMGYRTAEPDPKFVADHPFLFCILRKEVVLFMGRVVRI